MEKLTKMMKIRRLPLFYVIFKKTYKITTVEVLKSVKNTKKRTKVSYNLKSPQFFRIQATTRAFLCSSRRTSPNHPFGTGCLTNSATCSSFKVSTSTPN